MLLIGLVGEKGSGKDTFALFTTKFSKPRKVLHIRFSDLLKHTLNLWNLDITRSNLQLLAQVLEESFGTGTIARGIAKIIQESKADIIILDGIRWLPDLDLLRKFEQNILVYITATPKLRFERLKARGEKQGESELSYPQFLKEEKAPNELLIPAIGQKADFKILNNGSLEEFKTEVLNFIKELKL